MILTSKKNKDGSFDVSYKCGWCGNKFDRTIRKTGANKSAVASQVKCRSCGNFIKTWE